MPRVRPNLVNDDPGLDPRFYALLGEMVVRWARFENVLGGDVAMLMTDPRASKLRQELPIAFRRRLALWGRLNRRVYAGIPFYTDYSDAIVKDAKALVEDRNFLVHNLWNTSRESPAKVTVSSLEIPRWEKRHYTDEGLAEINKKIQGLHGRLASHIVGRLLSGDMQSGPLEYAPVLGDRVHPPTTPRNAPTD